jgi:hypothetical protein
MYLLGVFEGCNGCLINMHFAVTLNSARGLLQELRQGKADLPTVIEGFFLGVFEAKGLDRSGFVVRAASPAALAHMPQSLHDACSAHCCCHSMLRSWVVERKRLLPCTEHASIIATQVPASCMLQSCIPTNCASFSLALHSA